MLPEARVPQGAPTSCTSLRLTPAHSWSSACNSTVTMTILQTGQLRHEGWTIGSGDKWTRIGYFYWRGRRERKFPAPFYPVTPKCPSMADGLKSGARNSTTQVSHVDGRQAPSCSSALFQGLCQQGAGVRSPSWELNPGIPVWSMGILSTQAEGMAPSLSLTIMCSSTPQHLPLSHNCQGPSH